MATGCCKVGRPKPGRPSLRVTTRWAVPPCCSKAVPPCCSKAVLQGRQSLYQEIRIKKKRMKGITAFLIYLVGSLSEYSCENEETHFEKSIFSFRPQIHGFLEEILEGLIGEIKARAQHWS